MRTAQAYATHASCALNGQRDYQKVRKATALPHNEACVAPKAIHTRVRLRQEPPGFVDRNPGPLSSGTPDQLYRRGYPPLFSDSEAPSPINIRRPGYGT